MRIDTASGAPHKPLLLLVVLDLAEQRTFGPDVLPLTPLLAFRFCSYWQIVAHRRKQKPDVRWPFTRLKTEGVCQPLDNNPPAEKPPPRGGPVDRGTHARLADSHDSYPKQFLGDESRTGG